MTREDVRKKFKEHNLTYADIEISDIQILLTLMAYEMDQCKDFPMKISKEVKFTLNKNKTIRNCFIFADGAYFKKREAISFNTDGFIGFAGWASDKNFIPFTTAFDKWIDHILKK